MVVLKVLLGLLASLLTAPAMAAAPSADTILRQAFENYRSSSSQSTVAMTVHRPDWERHMQMRGWTRGDNDALVRFTAPAKDAGNATLKVGSDTWVYNPNLNQVIKLPASMMTQSWMGSDFSYNDLSKSEDIITDYTHRLTGTTQAGGHSVWTIEAIPKPGAPVVWGKVVLQVRDDYVLMGETFYDQDGKPARRMTADRIAPLAGRPYPVSMTMQPLDRPAQWTKIETSDAKFNVALPAYLFTLSNLQNPRS
ncbi:MAG TPA: outer membrane lipoprotein-sorting protein [Caulobacteraceae bacterium]|jgi:outer membrane lipoprotein-sorting protein